jgi:hypothetical protein
MHYFKLNISSKLIDFHDHLHYINSHLLRPAPTGTGTIALDQTFGSFTLFRTGFTLGESVSSVKVFRLFRLEWIYLVFRVWTQ